MDNKNFEQLLNEMDKPEIIQLKHQDMLANAMINAKEKSVLSIWWLSVPLYMLAMLLMKSFFVPSTTLFSNLHALAQQMRYTAILFFVIVPLVFIVLNIFSIRKIYLFSGYAKGFTLFKMIWFNLIIILASLIILMIYF